MKKLTTFFATAAIALSLVFVSNAMAEKTTSTPLKAETTPLIVEEIFHVSLFDGVRTDLQDGDPIPPTGRLFIKFNREASVTFDMEELFEMGFICGFAPEAPDNYSIWHGEGKGTYFGLEYDFITFVLLDGVFKLQLDAGLFVDEDNVESEEIDFTFNLTPLAVLDINPEMDTEFNREDDFYYDGGTYVYVVFDRPVNFTDDAFGNANITFNGTPVTADKILFNQDPNEDRSDIVAIYITPADFDTDDVLEIIIETAVFADDFGYENAAITLNYTITPKPLIVEEVIFVSLFGDEVRANLQNDDLIPPMGRMFFKFNREVSVNFDMEEMLELGLILGFALEAPDNYSLWIGEERGVYFGIEYDISLVESGSGAIRFRFGSGLFIDDKGVESEDIDYTFYIAPLVVLDISPDVDTEFDRENDFYYDGGTYVYVLFDHMVSFTDEAFNTINITLNGINATADRILLNQDPNEERSDIVAIYITPADFNANNALEIIVQAGMFKDDYGYKNDIITLNYTIENDESASLSVAHSTTTLRIYPNPVQSILHIETNDLKQVEILDMLGRTVMQNNSQPLDVSNLKKGLYLVRTTTNNGQIISQRFVKR